MAEPQRELLNLASTVTFLEDSQDEKLYVKGFASAKTEDRGGDLVPPQEFKIKQFMSAPTLLINHKFWIDNRGNSVAVGKPVELYASKLVNLKDNDEDWGVKDADTGEIINKFPRSKMPNLKAGDEGLFVVAEVTQPDVKEMVERGELQAFSWRGLVNVDYQVNSDGTTSRVLTDIDLYEISLVNVPANPDATFIIGKTEGYTDEKCPLVVHQIRLEKEFFQKDGDALHYLNQHNLLVDSIRSDTASYFSLQKSADQFDLTHLVSVKLREGVYAIAGPLLKDKAAAFGGISPISGGAAYATELEERLSKLEAELKKKKKESQPSATTSGGGGGKPAAPKAPKPKTTSRGSKRDEAAWKKALERAAEAAVKERERQSEQEKLWSEARDLQLKKDNAVASGNSAEAARIEGMLRDNDEAQRNLMSDAERKGDPDATRAMESRARASTQRDKPSTSSISRGDKYKRDAEGQFARGNIGGPGRPKSKMFQGLLVAAKSISLLQEKEKQMAEENTTVLEEENLENTEEQSVVTDEATEILESESPEEISDDAIEAVAEEVSEELENVVAAKGGYKKKEEGAGGEGGGGGGGAQDCAPNQVYDEAEGKCVASKEAEDLNVLASFLAEEAAKGISTQLSPVFESFAQSLKAIGDGMEAIASKAAFADESIEPETKPEPEAEPESEQVEEAKSVEDPMQSVASVLQSLQAQLVETQQQVAEVSKTADAISQSTPEPIDREESIKSADDPQKPNDCFDNIWPFLGQ